MQCRQHSLGSSLAEDRRQPGAQQREQPMAVHSSSLADGRSQPNQPDLRGYALETGAADSTILDAGHGDCIVLYSDSSAKYIEEFDEHVIEICWHAFDQRDPTVHHASRLTVPLWFIALLVVRGTYIGQGEELAAISAFYTAPQLFMNRKVIHFVDNSAALGACVNGYSGKADMARLVNMFHLALVALNVDWYGEWVPSEANIADLMTRPDKRGWQELKAGLEEALGEEAVEAMRRYEMKLPPLGKSFAELKEWFLEVREARSCPMDRA